MHPTLITIPRSLGGVDVFGFGWALLIWAIASVVYLVLAARRAGWGAAYRAHLPSILLLGATIALALPLLTTDEGLLIRGYGVMVVLGIAAGVGLSVWRARRAGLHHDVILNLAFWLFCFGMVGARLFYVIEYWQRQFHKETLAATIRAVFDFTSGGLVVFGALLAGLAGLALFVRRYRLPGLALCDVIAPGMAIGLALGRVGCFFTGCCYGGVCDLPWAVTFPGPQGRSLGAPPYADQARSGALYGLAFQPQSPPTDPPVLDQVPPDSSAAQAGLKSGDRIVRMIASNSRAGQAGSPQHTPIEVRSIADVRRILALQFDERGPITVWVDDRPPVTLVPPARSLPVHPAQLYAAFDALLLALLLLAAAPFCRRDGALFALLITLHPVSRFLLEVIRVDEAAVFQTGLSISQNISILLLVGAVVVWIYVLRDDRRPSWPAEYAIG